ncbi:PREDICTED: uncharacterized protein LOC105969559 [Erythranthe guttata]|uniref:uncharacterized protein LOC105969559 n=1 Tax=Erythranthe guttata TaxID=4155 RepID=UPI00064DF842|nr:PREDICTED: uncharacterized protein LOC105969559 [Erythranthe guttata]|eukprot:XP_012849787.1 PREDICTED: uncharacterized protein LOC105969559 [Erythranthe guttata]
MKLSPTTSGELLGSCKYRDELHIISIDSDSTLKDIFFHLARKWIEFEINGQTQILTVQYRAPHENMYVTLGDDEDVSNMVALHRILKTSIIDILVTRKENINFFSQKRKKISEDSFDGRSKKKKKPTHTFGHWMGRGGLVNP